MKIVLRVLAAGLAAGLCMVATGEEPKPAEGAAKPAAEQAKPADATPKLPVTYRLNRKLLDESLAAGKTYLLLNQTEQGNFAYAYDIETRRFLPGDSQVRQAGALWGVSLCHADQPTLLTQRALTAGLAFYAKSSKEDPKLGRYVVYESDHYGMTGTMALVTLTHLELMGSQSTMTAEEKRVFSEFLRQYLKFLMHLRRDDGQFASFYKYTNGAPFGLPSSYYDGESALAMAKAADLLHDQELAAKAVASVDAMYAAYAAGPIAGKRDDKEAKSWFQWGCMAMRELYVSGWPGTEKYAQQTIDYAQWMIDVHQILTRSRNTGYAYEGILSAYDLARRIGDTEAADRLASVTDQGLYRLTTWQVGGPLENDYLSKLKAREPTVVGGVLNSANDPLLRIDVTQHQMHAVLLARRYLYTQSMQ